MRSTFIYALLFAAAFGCSALAASAQLSLASTVDLALRNSPKVRASQADVDKAKATLSETKYAFIPSVSTSGGAGTATGVPLGLPVIFSINAQSLVFNFAQPDYIRSARAGLESARLSLTDTQTQVAEDAANTYVALDNALQRRAALLRVSDVVHKLSQIVDERYSAGMEAHIEVTRTRRTAAQVGLQQLLLDDEIEALSLHLNQLTGTGGTTAATIHSSIPAFPEPSTFAAATPQGAPLPQSDAVNAAFLEARARAFTANGDRRYLFHPQLGFSAEYSRISTAFNSSYILYYPGFDPARHPGISYNSLELGVQITVPLLDLVHRAKAQQSAADSAHAFAVAESAKIEFIEGRSKLRHTAAELAQRHTLAGLDRDLAQDQLDTIETQLKSTAPAGTAALLSPKDAENARLEERQRAFDLLTAELQYDQTEIMLLQQTGALGQWLKQALPSPADAVPVTALSSAVPQR